MFRHYTQYCVLSYCLGIDHGVQYTNVVILTSRAVVSALYLPFSFSFGNSLAAAFMSVITWNEWILNGISILGRNDDKYHNTDIYYVLELY